MNLDLVISQSEWIMPFSFGVLAGTALFALYVEFSPGMGSIWIRPDSTGKKVIKISGLINLMKQSLVNRHLWNWRNWDVNYAVVATCSGGLGILSHKLFLKT